MRLTGDDLFSPKVESYLQEQAALRRDMPEALTQPLIIRVIYSSYFYLSIAGCAGAISAWALVEPHLNDRQLIERQNLLPWLILFPLVSGFIGMFLGAAEGLMCRNVLRAIVSSSVGLGIGILGGAIALFPAGIVISLMTSIANNVSKPPAIGEFPKGMNLLIRMMGRACYWALAAIPAGLGQGIALREKKVVVNGLLGAVLGGLAGGLLFDPIYFMLSKPDTAAVSRGVGFGAIGILVGLFIGFVEQWTKTAWLLMKAGPLSGKQFVLYRDPTVIGSAPTADIYIFKDPDIEPRHALIHNRGGRFEIEDCGTKDGTYVNGVPVTKRILQAGDQIVIGKTLLEFSLKENR